MKNYYKNNHSSVSTPCSGINGGWWCWWCWWLGWLVGSKNEMHGRPVVYRRDTAKPSWDPRKGNHGNTSDFFFVTAAFVRYRRSAFPLQRKNNLPCCREAAPTPSRKEMGLSALCRCEGKGRYFSELGCMMNLWIIIKFTVYKVLFLLFMLFILFNLIIASSLFYFYIYLPRHKKREREKKRKEQ